MPKVNEDYRYEKREALLDVAQKVCNKKCIYDVTMRDIVVESGISQGGLYCYFKNIDEIFVALINRFTKHSNLSEMTSEILVASVPVDQTLHKLCLFFTNYMADIVNNYGKVIYELNFLYLHYPERFELVKHQLKEQAILSDFKNKFVLYLNQQVEKGNVRPSVGVEHLLVYWNATYEGIMNRLNFSSQNDKCAVLKTIQTMMELMEQTMRIQLNINEEKKYD